ncbi:hypothetical protein C0991_003575 [Blastosporella zonata]|nr:hypothetical protein C0991_003575 [Blastosporella zonata]
MTRTARSSFPRAINRDRSESKSGLDKSIRKNGAGAHSWGSLADERELELAAMDDEEVEVEDLSSDNLSTSSEPLEEKKPALQRSNSALTNDELETAKKFRKNVLKTNNLDLSEIARTSSAVATSPKSATPLNTTQAIEVDTSPTGTTPLETPDDTLEPGPAKKKARTLENEENCTEHDPSKSMTLNDESLKPQAPYLNVSSSHTSKEMSTAGSQSAAVAREPASCPLQEEMLRHEVEPCSSTRETRHDATDTVIELPSLLSSRIDALLADPIVPFTLGGRGYVGRGIRQYLSTGQLPLAEPYFCQPLSETRSHELPSDATPAVTHHIPRRVFRPSKDLHSISFGSSECLDPTVVSYLQNALYKAVFFAASDVARVHRKCYDSQPNVLSDLETPFTWSDPAEPILFANRRMCGTIILDSIAPFLAPHIIINAPPPQLFQLTENNTTPYTQDAAFGDRLVVNAFSTEVINTYKGWEYKSSYASSSNTVSNWEYESSYPSSTVDLLESASEYSRPGTPLPGTPVDSGDDCHFLFPRHDDDKLEEESSGNRNIYGIESPAEAGLGSDKLQSVSQSRPLFYIDEDDDELPSLDGW